MTYRFNGPSHISVVGEDQDGIKVTGEYVLILTKMPFQMLAPKSDLYFWHLPKTWSYDNKGQEIVVNKANKGSYPVSVLTAKVDWEKKEITQHTYAVQVNIGAPPTTRT